MITLKTGARLVIAAGLLRLSLLSLQMLAAGPQAFEAPFGPKYAQEWSWVCLHGLSSVVVLSLGPVLLLRLTRFHRRLGQVYLLCAWMAALSGLPLCLRAEGGIQARLSFLVLDSLWMVSAWQAYKAARARHWELHRNWVEVHYLLACSAAFLRIGLGLGDLLELPLQQVAGVVAWLSWQPGFWLGWRRGLWTKDRLPH